MISFLLFFQIIFYSFGLSYLLNRDKKLQKFLDLYFILHFQISHLKKYFKNFHYYCYLFILYYYIQLHYFIQHYQNLFFFARDLLLHYQKYLQYFVYHNYTILNKVDFMVTNIYFQFKKNLSDLRKIIYYMYYNFLIKYYHLQYYFIYKQILKLDYKYFIVHNYLNYTNYSVHFLLFHIYLNYCSNECCLSQLYFFNS